mmetsp:Transcript_45513/g.114650  ORF Transcript_45513/g.114650 Transcript_45513/m.114650 type:complete len:239 (+) Transcript_45513:889-1605(+)
MVDVSAIISLRLPQFIKRHAGELSKLHDAVPGWLHLLRLVLGCPLLDPLQALCFRPLIPPHSSFEITVISVLLHLLEGGVHHTFFPRQSFDEIFRPWSKALGVRNPFESPLRAICRAILFWLRLGNINTCVGLALPIVALVRPSVVLTHLFATQHNRKPIRHLPPRGLEARVLAVLALAEFEDLVQSMVELRLGALVAQTVLSALLPELILARDRHQRRRPNWPQPPRQLSPSRRRWR